MNDAQNSVIRSESIANLAAALSKFQSEVDNPTKDSQGHNYKYADLANIFNAVKQPLANNKLSVCQMLGSGVQGVSVTTILMHESGEYIQSEYSIPQETSSRMSGPQQAGTTITYARRYAIAACLGIAQEDPDAPKQTAPQSDEEKPEPVNQSPQPKNTEQLTRLAKDACAEIHAMTKVGQIHVWTVKNEKKLETLKASNEALLLMVTNALDTKNKELTEQEMPVAETHGQEPDPTPAPASLNSDEEIPF